MEGMDRDSGGIRARVFCIKLRDKCNARQHLEDHFLSHSPPPIGCGSTMTQLLFSREKSSGEEGYVLRK